MLLELLPSSCTVMLSRLRPEGLKPIWLVAADVSVETVQGNVAQSVVVVVVLPVVVVVVGSDSSQLSAWELTLLVALAMVGTTASSGLKVVGVLQSPV